MLDTLTTLYLLFMLNSLTTLFVNLNTALAHRDRHGGAGWKEDQDVAKKVAKWLNRVLAMTLEDQALLFRYFSDTMDAIILAARSRGEYDLGIQSVQASSITVQDQKVIHTDTGSGELSATLPCFLCSRAKPRPRLTAPFWRVCIIHHLFRGWDCSLQIVDTTGIYRLFRGWDCSLQVVNTFHIALRF